MARPPGRLTRRVEFWTTEAQADALNQLNNGGLLNKADHLRLACELYLQQFIANSPPRQNGQDQHQGAAHAVV